jgi:uncharacterized protein with PIN domain
LAKYLRLLGFDTLHFSEGDDKTLERIARKEERILLTRDRVLCDWAEAECFFPINIDTESQLKEILAHYDLYNSCRPFSRCMVCNGLVHEVENVGAILTKVPKKVREFNQRFWQCESCKKIYWHGTHYKRMKERVAAICAG